MRVWDERRGVREHDGIRYDGESVAHDGSERTGEWRIVYLLREVPGYGWERESGFAVDRVHGIGSVGGGDADHHAKRRDQQHAGKCDVDERHFRSVDLLHDEWEYADDGIDAVPCWWIYVERERNGEVICC